MVDKIKGSAIVWQGWSHLDRSAPIVAVVTGLDASSDNPKTAAMAQLWIIRSDVHPLTAVLDGRDRAVCGDCGLRGTVGSSVDRGCYVTIVNAPRAVYDAYKRKRYARVSPAAVNARLAERGLSLRLGAYGDPAAMPIGVLRELTAGINHTGYTHQWRKRPYLRSLLMASTDTPVDYQDAIAAGWRSFRARAADWPLIDGEIVCPASNEAGHKTVCADCNLCNGSNGPDDRRRNLAIIAHGPVAVHALSFIRKRTETQING